MPSLLMVVVAEEWRAVLAVAAAETLAGANTAGLFEELLHVLSHSISLHHAIFTITL